MKTDIELQRDVLEELKFEPAIDAAQIGVTVKDSVVTLSGFVPSYTEKSAAERAAKRVFGVKGVAEEIKVNLPSFYQRTDADIAHSALNAIGWNVLIPSEQIKVTVADGSVTLEGEVDWQYQKKAAREAVQLLSRVKWVTNLITIKPKITPTEIKSNILSAFKRSAEIDAQQVTVETDKNKVVLRGRVRSWSELDAAERTAWAVPGVAQVENHLKIQV